MSSAAAAKDVAAADSYSAVSLAENNRGRILTCDRGRVRSNVSYDAGLAARMADCLESIGERKVRQKNVFGGRGFLVGKTTFAIAWDLGLIVKTGDEYAAALQMPGVTRFTPDGEKPMSTWVVVAADAIADDPELTDWLRRGLRAVR